MPNEPQIPINRELPEDMMQDEELKQEMSQEDDEPVDLSTYTLDAKFTDEEEKEILKLCSNEMTVIMKEYEDEQYFTNCKKADEEDIGLHDSQLLDESEPDIKLLLTTITTDILASRAYRQTWTPSPCVVMEAEYDTGEEDTELENLTKRVEYLDYYVRTKSKLQDKSLPLYRAGLKYRSAVLKTCLDHEEEPHTFKKFYRPGNPKDIEDYQKKYEEKIADNESKEYEEYQQLIGGQGGAIAKKEEEEEVIYHGAKHYRVNWKNFFARLSIKDFRKHIAIMEKFTYNWYEIESREGFWDKDAIKDIKSRYSDYDERNFDFYEAIVQYRRKKNGRLDRYLITYEAETEKIVRAKYYPYKHMMYVAYSPFESDKSWLGEMGISERMFDIAATANAVINSFVKEQDLAHTPIIISSGKKTGDWTIKLGQPNLLPVDPGQAVAGQSQFMQYRMENVSSDRIQFLQWIFTYIAILTGIDLIQSAGASDPLEKNPTNLRTQMKQIASTIRVEDIILSFQKSDAETLKYTEDIIYRFPEKYDNEGMTWYKNGEKVSFDTSIMTQPVRYIMSGSRMSFDREKDLQVIMATIDFVAKFFPEELNDVEVKKELLNAVLSNTQGTVEKMKERLIKPMEMMIEAKKESLRQLEQAKQEAQAKGIDFGQFLREKAAKGGGGMAMPPQGPQRPPTGQRNAPQGGSSAPSRPQPNPPMGVL